jgi:hypothetical protein
LLGLEPFLIFYWRDSPVYYFIVALGRISEEGALFIEGTLSWRPRSEDLTEGSLHRHYISPIYRLAVFCKGLEAIFKEAKFLASFSQLGRIITRSEGFKSSRERN